MRYLVVFFVIVLIKITFKNVLFVLILAVFTICFVEIQAEMLEYKDLKIVAYFYTPTPSDTVACICMYLKIQKQTKI